VLKEGMSKPILLNNLLFENKVKLYVLNIYRNKVMFKLKTLFSRIMSIEPIRRQSIVSLLWQIGVTAIGFLSTMYFAHAVGATVLGAYYLFIAYFGIINLMTDGGFGGASIKRISEGEEQDEYFSASLVLRTLFTIVVIIVLIAFRRHFADISNAGVLVWLMLALVVSLFQGVLLAGLAGLGKIGISTTADFINNVSRTFIQIVAVILGYNVAGLIGGFIVGMLFAVLFMLRFYNLNLKPFHWRHVKSLFSFSFWSFLVSSGGLVFVYADSMMIGYYMDNASVGVYRVIFQLTAFAAFTTTAIRGTLWPRVSRWEKTGEIELIEESLSHAFTYSLILALPLFIGGALLGDKLLYYFYGADFVDYKTLIVLFIVQIVNVFEYFFTAYLTAMNKLKELFNVSIIAVTTNIVLNAALIPLMGISGAAVATLISITLNALLARRLLARTIAVRLERSSLVNLLKASITMGLIVAIFRLVVPLSSIWITLVPVVLGGLAYGLLVLKYDKKICGELKGILTTLS
jgi:O-antigen/teichoic acid export membrane protein